MNEPLNSFESALDAAAKGYSCIPCYPGTKVPMVKWKQYQTTKPTDEEYCEWFSGTRNNVAIICSNLVIFDVDDPDRVGLVIHHCGDTPHQLRTPGGGLHLGYRKRKGAQLTNRVKIKGMGIDLKTDGGLEMIPPSSTEEGAYQWLTQGLRPISELPYGNIGWTRERTKKVLLPVMADCADPHRLLERGKMYVDCFERAVSGKRGHHFTWIAALKIRTFVGGDPALLWQLLCYFNATKCEPEWDEKALRHKWQDVLKKAK